MKIEILYFKGCPNHEPAKQAIRDVLGELNIDAEISNIDVPDEATAASVRFPGSPTIRIDGEDVVPQDSNGVYSLSCRLYQTSSGLASVPDYDAIRAAIRRAIA